MSTSRNLTKTEKSMLEVAKIAGEIEVYPYAWSGEEKRAIHALRRKGYLSKPVSVRRYDRERGSMMQLWVYRLSKKKAV